MKERWRVVAGTGSKYFVSSEGRVWSQGRKPGQYGGGSYAGKILKQTPGKNGYPMVSLAYAHGKTRNRTVHSLVAEAFIGPRPPGQHVRHRNNDAMDARLSNLRYGTPKENEADKRCCPNCGWKW